jgi:hypothetical protein
MPEHTLALGLLLSLYRDGEMSITMGDVMRTCLSWIQPHPHGVILRHLLNMVYSFLCFSTNYLENRLLPNDFIIVRNDGDDEDEEWDFKRALERPRDVHIKVEIQSNSKF